MSTNFQQRLLKTSTLFLILCLLFIWSVPICLASPNASEYRDGRKLLKEYSIYQPEQELLFQESLTYSNENYEQLRQDWLRRQGQKFFPDLERRWTEIANERLRSVVTLFSSLIDEPAPPKNEDPKKSSEPKTKKTTAAQKEAEKRMSALRFSRINSMEYRLQDGSEFSMLLDPTGARVNYFRSLNNKITYGIEHTSTNSQTLFIYRFGF